MILTLRTDKPETEIGLYDGRREMAYVTWEAHRQLAETIHSKLRDILRGEGLALQNITAIAVFRGPGSFTGLRIGIAVANALAAGLNVPIVGANGENWIQSAIKGLQNYENQVIVIPEYGSPVRTTQQRK